MIFKRQLLIWVDYKAIDDNDKKYDTEDSIDNEGGDSDDSEDVLVN